MEGYKIVFKCCPKETPLESREREFKPGLPNIRRNIKRKKKKRPLFGRLAYEVPNLFIIKEVPFQSDAANPTSHAFQAS